MVGSPYRSREATIPTNSKFIAVLLGDPYQMWPEPRSQRLTLPQHKSQQRAKQRGGCSWPASGPRCSPSPKQDTLSMPTTSPGSSMEQLHQPLLKKEEERITYQRGMLVLVQRRNFSLTYHIKGVTIVLPNRGWEGTVVRFRMSKTFP